MCRKTSAMLDFENAQNVLSRVNGENRNRETPTSYQRTSTSAPRRALQIHANVNLRRAERSRRGVSANETRFSRILRSPDRAGLHARIRSQNTASRLPKRKRGARQQSLKKCGLNLKGRVAKIVRVSCCGTVPLHYVPCASIGPGTAAKWTQSSNSRITIHKNSQWLTPSNTPSP